MLTTTSTVTGSHPTTNILQLPQPTICPVRQELSSRSTTDNQLAESVVERPHRLQEEEDSEEEDAIVYKTPFVLDRSALEYELAIDGQDEGQDHNISSPSNPNIIIPSSPPAQSKETARLGTPINSRDGPLHHLSNSNDTSSSSPPSVMQSSLSNPQSYSHSQLLPSSGGNRSNRNSRQSSAPSPESDIKLSPRQRQITSETSSCPSDNEISSLYGKYRNSGYSINENFEQDQQQDDSENSRQYSFTQGDDANGLPLGRTSTVIDELTWMLGEAIDSAQTTFGNPEEITSETQDQLSDVRSYSPLVNGLDRLSIDKGRNLHTPQGIRPGEHSAEDLSEPITASSLSDYSADESEDLQGAKDRRVYNLVDSTPSCAVDETLKHTYSAYDLDALTKSEDNSPSQDPSKITRAYNKEYTESVISTGVQSTSSEEVLSTSAIEDSHIQLLRRSPSHKRDHLVTSQKLQDLVLASKQDALRETRQSTSSSHPQPIVPVNPSTILDSDVSANVVTRSNSEKPPNIPAKHLVQEDQYLLPKLASPSGKQLMARSPVVKRASSDMSFLEQWQWLESQHPSSSPPKKKHSITTEPAKPSHIASSINTREKCIQALDKHFTSASGSIDLSNKMAILSKRQLNLQLSCHRQNANKSTRATKQVGALFDRVPTITIRELKKLKGAADRCQIYENKLQEIYSQPTGLDVWIWLKTCGESQSSAAEGYKFTPTTDSGSNRPFYSQARKPGYSPLMNHHQLPLSSLPAHLQYQQSSNPQQVFSAPSGQIRETSMSSIASFPLRAGSSQKAIQIRRTSENQLVEIVHPDRSNAMIMNSLMEVNNLPYPSLYPHSAGQHLGVQQAPSESSSLSSPMSSKLSGGSRSILESSSKVVGGAGGRFFSQIKRHNSTKRRNQSASASSSPTKSNLIISAPMITGPLTGPRGPRPELGSSSKVGGNELKGLFTKTQDVMTIAPSRMSHDEQPCSPRTTSRGNHRMSFAYGTSTHRHPPTTAQKPTHQQYQVSSGYGGGEALGRRPSEPIDRSLNYHHYITSSSQQQQQNSHSILQPSTLDHPDSFIIDSKLDKLADILPQADRNLLRQILIDNHLDDVVTIGRYLELVKN
ncbi:hypothetical protein PSTG_16507 [Puccinia striiformis f. sp. tritici PST-78]|uniref:CUE domain-containing protein n=2 Tax=Puccinia striiformis f. sp. tritici TaxID=168172 RepID=A0A0L0USR3_9BASI|nr:hypothetical protein PSTG_16507 [Puccinia striiformis f. sp. tritici PST-78]